MVERLNRIQDEYVSPCVGWFGANMNLLVELLVTQICENVEKLCGRRSAYGNRTYHNSSMSSLSSDTNLACKALLAVITSSLFRTSCGSSKTISRIGQLVLKLQKGPAALVSEIKNTIFNILEALSQHGDILLENPGDILDTLAPVLATSMVSSQSGDTRFLCAKVLCDMVLFYISEVYGQTQLSGGSASSNEAASCQEIEALLGEQIRENILPNLPALLDDEDPIPLYSLKMLIAVLDFDAQLTAAVSELGLVRNFISYLSLDHPNNNVHNLRLCKIMTNARDVALGDLLACGIVEKAASVLSYTCENMVEAFMEPSLELCFAIISRVSEEGEKESLRAMAGTCMQQIMSLGKHADLGVSEMAGKCVRMLS